MPSEPSQFQARFHALDAVRAASLLVILEHSAVSYMASPMPSLLWAVHDRSASRAVDWVFWMAQMTAMPLFFFTGGFFAARLYQTRGPRAFLLHRTRTLLGPLFFGGLILLPLTYYVWAYGWLVSGRCTVGEILAVQFRSEIQRELFGLAHLWFLQYLLLMCVAFCGIQHLRSRQKVRCSGKGLRGTSRFQPFSNGPVKLSPIVSRLPKAIAGGRPDSTDTASENYWLVSPIKRFLLTVPAGIILALHPGVAIDFHNSFFPDPWRFVYYSIFFIAGLALYQVHNALWRFVRFSGAFLIFSIPPFIGLCWLLGRYTAADMPLNARALLGLCNTLFVWFFLFGCLGLCVRFFSRPCPPVRYLADASFWIYLCHLPIVGLMQSALYNSSLSGPQKFLLVFAFVVALSLLSYQWIVRGTRWGELLCGTPGLAGPNR
jgi:glucan biosynthesis protein C